MSSANFAKDDHFQWVNMLVGFELLSKQHREEVEASLQWREQLNLASASANGDIHLLNEAGGLSENTLAYANHVTNFLKAGSGDGNSAASLSSGDADLGSSESAVVSGGNSASSSNVFGSIVGADSASTANDIASESVDQTSIIPLGFELSDVGSAVPAERDYSVELNSALDDGVQRLDQGLYGDFRGYSYDIYNGLEAGGKAVTGDLVDEFDATGVPVLADVYQPFADIEYVDTISALPSAITSEVRSTIGDINDIRTELLTA